MRRPIRASRHQCMACNPHWRRVLMIIWIYNLSYFIYREGLLSYCNLCALIEAQNELRLSNSILRNEGIILTYIVLSGSFPRRLHRCYRVVTWLHNNESPFLTYSSKIYSANTKCNFLDVFQWQLMRVLSSRWKQDSFCSRCPNSQTTSKIFYAHILNLCEIRIERSSQNWPQIGYIVHQWLEMQIAWNAPHNMKCA